MTKDEYNRLSKMNTDDKRWKQMTKENCGWLIGITNNENGIQRRKKSFFSLGNKGEHKSWAVKFYLCEVLNFVNVVVQVCIVFIHSNVVVQVCIVFMHRNVVVQVCIVFMHSNVVVQVYSLYVQC